MKTLSGAALIAVAVLFSGCSHRHVGPVYHAGDERPPDFIAGPIGAALTNYTGFGAHVSATIIPPEGPRKIVTGQVLSREGRLIFQPDLPIKGKRAHTEGGLFFIWDVGQHFGYVMSEALQGYAPVASEAEAPGSITLDKEGVPESVNGHPTHKCNADVNLTSGRKARLTLWLADDERHFPVRIESVDGAEHIILNLSEVRFEYPNQSLFHPPDGFTAYKSSVALMNELIVRDASLAKKYQAAEFQEPAPVSVGNWHQPIGTPP